MSTPPKDNGLVHLPPSQPSSPEHKRQKAATETAPEAATTSPQKTAPAFSSVAAAHPVEGIDTSPPQLLIKRISPTARLPTKGSAFAAGHDVYASEATVVPARGKAVVATGLNIAVPAGCYGRIAPRSGLAAKNSIDTGAGVIDADYRGEVKVLLFNFSDTDFQINEGDRIAQLILERVLMTDVLEVQELSETVRGVGGFGSTGTA